MSRYTVEPMIVPAPYDFICPDCADDVEENDPVAWVEVGATRGKFLICQECAAFMREE